MLQVVRCFPGAYMMLYCSLLFSEFTREISRFFIFCFMPRPFSSLLYASFFFLCFFLHFVSYIFSSSIFLCHFTFSCHAIFIFFRHIRHHIQAVFFMRVISFSSHTFSASDACIQNRQSFSSLPLIFLYIFFSSSRFFTYRCYKSLLSYMSSSSSFISAR